MSSTRSTWEGWGKGWEKGLCGCGHGGRLAWGGGGGGGVETSARAALRPPAAPRPPGPAAARPAAPHRLLVRHLRVAVAIHEVWQVAGEQAAVLVHCLLRLLLCGGAGGRGGAGGVSARAARCLNFSRARCPPSAAPARVPPRKAHPAAAAPPLGPPRRRPRSAPTPSEASLTAPRCCRRRLRGGPCCAACRARGRRRRRRRRPSATARARRGRRAPPPRGRPPPAGALLQGRARLARRPCPCPRLHGLRRDMGRGAGW
jgi:hypothetical protein